MSQNGLPPGWVWLSLEDVLERGEYGTSVKCDYRSSGIAVLRIPNISGGTITLDDLKYATAETEYDESDYLQPGDLLVCRTNGSIGLVGKTALVRAPFGSPVAFASYLLRFRFWETTILPLWIHFFFSTHQARAFIEANAASSAGQHNISLSLMRRLQIPVPPLNEQQRIVAKVDELFSDLDAGVAALQRAKANLKRYRAAVLKAAVEGTLTEEWRAAHPDTEPASRLLERILAEQPQKRGSVHRNTATNAEQSPPQNREGQHVEPTPAATVGLPKLPSGWCWASIEDTIDIIDYRGRTPPYSGEGIPHLRSFNVKQGKIDWDGITYVTEETYREYMTRGLPEEGDLLFTTEAPLGEVGLAPADIRFSIAQRLLLLRPRFGLLDSNFLMYQLMAPDFQARLRFRQTGSTVTGVSSRNFKPLPIRIPPLLVQRAIAEEVERQCSSIAAAESYIAASLKRAVGLRQSILKTAFAGRLVPQDPDDEPASELLERIRRDRARANATSPAQAQGVGRRRKQRGVKEDRA